MDRLSSLKMSIIGLQLESDLVDCRQSQILFLLIVTVNRYEQQHMPRDFFFSHSVTVTAQSYMKKCHTVWGSLVVFPSARESPEVTHFMNPQLGVAGKDSSRDW